MGGSPEELNRLANPEDITRLVVFDTWTLNVDRHFPDERERRPNRDNVFLSTERTGSGQHLLLAMDHTHCFTRGGELSRHLARIERIREDRIYGLFPEFLPYLRRSVLASCVNDLRIFTQSAASDIIRTIPDAWQVEAPARIALVEFLYRRAGFLAENIVSLFEQNLETGFLTDD